MTEPTATTESPHDFAADIAAIGRIAAVPRLLQVLCQTTGMGFAAVARVTEGSWVACAVEDRIDFGLKAGGQLDVNTTLCKEVRESRLPVAIDHASADPVYANHHTPRIYEIESYVSVPIVLEDGSYFGNLCAIDPRPAKVSEPRILATFVLFAQLVALEFENERKRNLVQGALLAEQATGELREQFIAVLGHDLRNPLAAIAACGQLVRLKADDPASTRALAVKINTNVKRMTGLIDDIADFARGRLGGGIALATERIDDLGQSLQQVVTELRDSHPERVIEARVEINSAVRCDRSRLQQLVSNLLANALIHGAGDGPVRLTAASRGHELVIEVWNDGEPIPASSLGKIFGPFWRRGASERGSGLGLGLHICDQIVKAHGGELHVASSREGGTTFSALLPVVAAVA